MSRHSYCRITKTLTRIYAVKGKAVLMRRIEYITNSSAGIKRHLKGKKVDNSSYKTYIKRIKWIESIATKQGMTV